MARLLSVNVGLPRDIIWQGKTVHTGIWKTPVEGRRKVLRLNIDGDGQGDLAGHGGEHRAVFVYQIDSYRYWRNQLGRQGFDYGQFGENFTVEGLPDTQVCIGDRYLIGRTLFEVTQPRVTCYRIGIRMNEPRMAALLVTHGRPGFYFRVLEEGEVQAGDEITLVEAGPEKMSVSEVNALLYMSGHPRDQLERALRIPALSIGWRRSFEALLAQDRKNGITTGNAGLVAASGPPPAWPGFRPFRVSRKVREGGNVISLRLEPMDGKSLPMALPGQYVVLQLGSATIPTIMRSYSLSAEPSASSYRVSVKREAHGVASTYIDDELDVGDVVRVSAARGNFTLRPGSTPVVLLSAGIGVTPVLAMLHALAAVASTREIWWLYGTRNGREHPFAEETRTLLKPLPNCHRHIRYSSPDPDDRPQIDFDAPGRFSMQVLRELSLPRDGDFYVCGPVTFMSEMILGLANAGVGSDRIHTETFGAGPSLTPGVAASPRRLPHPPAGLPGSGPLVSFARSGVNVRWGSTFSSLLELAESCDVPVRWSCRTGVCHNCESGLIAGTICYEPDPIDAPAEGNVLICCSRPQGDIVIDL
ncbi:MOSC and FAD-binding oxidoreductase domain-containing protein [Methylobacterium nodulans]|uniref:nitric oxide dioxygenase n=1 Tax=Methylobacterium nodulans (strain LMG 21967 / CNCM I-2342 / ORS 2060) TaxID=460265 RepID=B8IC37_METNO|nr:MOSC and FAD-binding oxidoreductase domain-containing protein [Methylobacterium nodulans]ACL61219.1 MOSC domain containing protein [Methylobacterium nodulans ORS 2060]